MKGSERNRPCPCGSGLKAKRCQGPHLEDIEAAYEEHQWREWAAKHPIKGHSPLAIAAILGTTHQQWP